MKQKVPKSFGYYIIIFISMVFMRAELILNFFQRCLNNFIKGLLEESSTYEERSDIIVRIYDTLFYLNSLPRGLWLWEENWFKLRLPQAPANILLGGAGSGREAEVLCNAGYSVNAFEPAPKAASICKKKIKNRGKVVIASYEDLNNVILDGFHNPIEIFASQHYDAVILGWGSLSHILSKEERERIIRASAILTPEGPILISFLNQNLWSKGNSQPGGRIINSGRYIGRKIAKIRGISQVSNNEMFSNFIGFAQNISNEEINNLAAIIGRQCVWEKDQIYPHVTFLKDK